MSADTLLSRHSPVAVKSGYSPACANEWVAGGGDKRAFRCEYCPNRRFLPVTERRSNNLLPGRTTVLGDVLDTILRTLAGWMGTAADADCD